MKKHDTVIGESDIFLSTLDKASRLAKIDRPVLIHGERGTGKELIAQRLHYLSPRWDKPFVTLNCAALSENLLDSELFGHESGSFTGAKQRHAGRFERAEGGTLFLDELGNAPLTVQEKLLRVIEYGEYERIGGSRTLSANVRLVCATNEDLKQAIVEKRFRADLLDRLLFDVIHVPPLRHRQEDILPLAEHYALRLCQTLGLQLFAGFTHRAQQALLQHPWEGNVRELKNTVERAVFHHQEETPIEEIVFDPLIAPWQETPMQEALISAPTLPFDLRQWQHQQEKHWLQQALQQTQYHQKNAAKQLGLSYDQLRGLLKKHQDIRVQA